MKNLPYIYSTKKKYVYLELIQPVFQDKKMKLKNNIELFI